MSGWFGRKSEAAPQSLAIDMEINGTWSVLIIGPADQMRNLYLSKIGSAATPVRLRDGEKIIEVYRP